MRCRILQRCCLSLLACVLLLAQWPGAHAMVMPQATPAGAVAAAHAEAGEPPCHGDGAMHDSGTRDTAAHDTAAHEPAPDAPCCGGSHCDDHCANPSWAPASVTASATAVDCRPALAADLIPAPVLRQPELLRPPI